ncbi:sel1 repeat family protein [Xenorhabdus sp. ZM]|nr:sel1 repeat family protein [Xenorhabdus sp. ZM]
MTCYSNSNRSENFNIKITQMDEETNLEILHELANSGHIGAQYELGIKYAEGKGVKQDSIKAKDWYEKAALQGDVDSQALLGHMYYAVEGILQDYIKAKEWFQKSCDNGYQIGCESVEKIKIHGE